MMNLQISVEIRAKAERVWDVLMDVERWPEWTQSIERVERLDQFGIGSRVRIRQPRVPAAIWKVTEFEPGSSFTWASELFGIKSVAGHRLKPSGEGVCLTLTFVQTGWLARLVRSRAETMARQYLAMESQGLKRRCEG